jgi:hypothetical protein
MLFELDVDVSPVDGVRIVQFTPPGSYCSIKLSTGIPELEMPAVRGGYFAYFSDPDGNTWTVQHLPWRH